MWKRGQELFFWGDIGKWDIGIEEGCGRGPEIPLRFDRDQALSLSDGEIED